MTTVKTADSGSHIWKVPAPTGAGWSIAARAMIVYGISWFLWALPFQPLERAFWQIQAKIDQALYPLYLRMLTLEPNTQLMDSYLGWFYKPTFAVAAAIVWWLLQRRPRSEPKLHEVARIMARYGLIAMVCVYAAEKFFTDQGGAHVNFISLGYPYGVWDGHHAKDIWLGYSTAYQYFAGWAEFGAGLLLYSRRFTTLGAWLALADMGMVWLINQSYWDGAGTSPLTFVPLALFLVAPHAIRTMNFFVRDLPGSIQLAELRLAPWFYRLSVACKVFMVPFVIYKQMGPQVAMGVSGWYESALAGMYRVETFSRNGVIEPIAASYPRRWREVAISERGGYIAVRMADDRHLTFAVATPPGDLPGFDLPLTGMKFQDRRSFAQYTASPQGEFKLHWGGLSSPWNEQESTMRDTVVIRYSRLGPDRLALDGVINADTLHAELRLLPKDSMPLIRHRWHPI
jgi:uncharacterized membrane protein YphA (DoxX/SURF4 family)